MVSGFQWRFRGFVVLEGFFLGPVDWFCSFLHGLVWCW